MKINYQQYQPKEDLFKTNPNLYLAKKWAIRFKELVITPKSIGGNLDEKRYFADKILVFTSNTELLTSEQYAEIYKASTTEKRKRMYEYGGKLTIEQRIEFSKDYFDLIDNLCDEIFKPKR